MFLCVSPFYYSLLGNIIGSSFFIHLINHSKPGRVWGSSMTVPQAAHETRLPARATVNASSYIAAAAKEAKGPTQSKE